MELFLASSPTRNQNNSLLSQFDSVRKNIHKTQTNILSFVSAGYSDTEETKICLCGCNNLQSCLLLLSLLYSKPLQMQQPGWPFPSSISSWHFSRPNHSALPKFSLTVKVKKSFPRPNRPLWQFISKSFLLLYSIPNYCFLVIPVWGDVFPYMPESIIHSTLCGMFLLPGSS